MPTASDNQDLDLRTTPHQLNRRRAVCWTLLAILVASLGVAYAYTELFAATNGFPDRLNPFASTPIVK
ncbi:hypothetical protein FHT78_001348 [Rhizobium sp. BK196]|uniref:hypothetical protein n=1 Tax=Rhizobium sp. BK196 TaxID=2587073 RepID=UPI001616F032|nr:hypothetical protein [Rhizobium sp. BK196]MBB3309619.1 hypothetical protein [Rhizobium sp. BK196]